MEILYKALIIILGMFALTGVAATVAFLVTLFIIKNGGIMTLGYEQDEQEEADNQSQN